ncbi:MAG TPA: transketolase [Candidatus Nanoarchaeia archaeon]|nr:transketolase [Candidatus Nanoarchaeia archaeon]
MQDNKLKEIAKEVRKDILTATCKAQSGHPGGSLSATDILVCLYFSKMKHNPKKPSDPDRDRFILSKGHAAPALYSCLARSGYFPIKELETLRQLGSRLQGHPERGKLPGIEASTGPLGQGLSFANGVALAGKLDKKTYKVYCMIGDGESQEGMIWEAAMTSAHYKLDNLCVILDHNRLQIDGDVEKVKGIEPIVDKFKSFNFEVIEIDGHNYDEILEALNKADKIKGKPTMIIANTIKGKGVACMENKAEWHGKACKPEELDNLCRSIA